MPLPRERDERIGRHLLLAKLHERRAAGHSGEDNLDMSAVASECIPADVDLSLLTEESELALMRKMSEFGDLVEGVGAAELYPERSSEGKRSA